MRGPSRVHESPRALLEHWLSALRILNVGHRIAGERYDVLARSTGVTAAVLSAIVGTAIFTSLASSSSTAVRATAAALSLIAAGLGTAQLVWNFPQREMQHRVASVDFGDLRREVEARLARSEPVTSADIDEVSTEWSRIEGGAPHIHGRLRGRAHRLIEQSDRRESETTTEPAKLAPAKVVGPPTAD